MFNLVPSMFILSRGALILLILGLFGDTGSEKGREGNAQFRDGRYEAAAATYRDGLSALEDTTGTLHTALQNNLGLALHKQESYGPARRALGRARRTATTKAERIRVRFNSGTVAAVMGNRAEALRHYRHVLLLDPTHEAARFNYEFLKRQGGGGGRSESRDLEPSAYAQKLKRKAEALVAREQYTTAAALMKDGLRQDSSVAAYQDFITRVEEVAQINRSQP